jgi:hypothetical protein
MKELSETIQGLENKLNILLERFTIQKKEVARLVSEREKLLEQLTEAKEANELLERKYAARSMANSIGDSLEGRKETKQKINELVREIDKCIHLLNN